MEKDDTKNAYRTRRIMSQFAATTVKMMLTFEFGLCITFSSIVIPALTGKSNEHNEGETIRISDEQASWIGSVLFICEPIGSLLSAIVTDYFGRRKTMMIVNIPYAVAWFMMYNASSVTEIVIANSLLGFGIGLMEAPIMTYVGEICEPSLRGVLITYTNLGTSLGGSLVTNLNTLMAWRTVGLICMAVPTATLVLLFFVPETPHWLLSKGRTDQAEKSLSWLRGWVPKRIVSDEFQSLQRFSEQSRSCNSCLDQNEKCTHPPATLSEKFAEFKRLRTRKSFAIVIALFVILQYSGIFAMTPYLVQIFAAYQSPMRPDVSTAVVSYLNICATITFMCLVRFVGKRRLYLTVLSGVCLSSFVISCYGFIFLPPGYHSFVKSHGIPELEGSYLVYIPTICLILWSFCSYCGILMMPWQMLSEIFSFKTRGMASGIAAAINYTIGFVTTKTYNNLEKSLSLPGISLFYCVIATVGLFLMYNIMPETENRSLEDIEIHFSDKTKKITDWYIPRVGEKHNSTMKPV